MEVFSLQLELWVRAVVDVQDRNLRLYSKVTMCGSVVLSPGVHLESTRELQPSVHGESITKEFFNCRSIVEAIRKHVIVYRVEKRRRLGTNLGTQALKGSVANEETEESPIKKAEQ